MDQKQGLFSQLKHDLPAGVVVFLVALPLCLGIAVASGAPPFSGLIAGIVGGTVVALASGSPLGVSGPAAGLAVIVLNAIIDLEAFDVFLLAVVIAGVIQFVLGILKAGVIGYYFPSAVIKGMLAGIGIYIFLKQLPYVIGYAIGPESDLTLTGGNIFIQLYNMFGEITTGAGQITLGAIVISTISLAILILWEQPFMKKLGFTSIIQGPLVVVVLGIVLYEVFQGGTMALLPKQLVTIPVSEGIGDLVGFLTFPDFSQITNPQVWIVGATIAVVASLETLLCVEATDKLDPQRRVTPTNRELLAQGAGNFASGLIGGLPVTQVIVRSSANIQSGGKTKMSAFFHGILLLVCVITIPNVINRIPYASLAAILLVVGFKLAKPAVFKQMYKLGWSQLIPFLVTIIGILLTDLLVGIGLGLAVAIVQILWNNYKLPYHFDPKTYVAGEPILIQLSEDVSFLNKAAIQNTLETVPNGAHVIVDATNARTVHPDILEIFENFKYHGNLRNVTLEVKGIDDTTSIFKGSPLGGLRESMRV
ncbi:MAG: SulP family inorganic anion transporter [Bacteroidota bacterium]